MIKRAPRQHIFVVREDGLPLVYTSESGPNFNKLTTPVFEDMKNAKIFCEFYLKNNKVIAQPKLVNDLNQVQSAFEIFDKMGIEKLEFLTSLKWTADGKIVRESLMGDIKELLGIKVTKWNGIDGNSRVVEKP